MRFLYSVGLCFLLSAANAQSAGDSLLNKLNASIEMRPLYLADKLMRIENLKKAASQLKEADRYQLYLKVYDEYKSFIYDSAFRYSSKLQTIAYGLQDPVKIGYTKIKLGFVLVSSGLFNEALDSLRTLKPKNLPDSIRSQYYYLMARTCYDLADFNRDDFYSTRYSRKGHAYIDSAVALTPSGTAQYFLMTGLRNVRQHNMKEGLTAFEEIIKNFKLSDADFAVAASTLSFIYLNFNDLEKSKEMLIRAAIADMRSSTKETLATLNLADMLYKEGDVDNAYKYVKIAMEDANFYGARHRKVQVAAVFPIIEGQQLNLVESKRQMLFRYAAVITLLTLLTIAFAFIIYKQFKNLREAKRVISEANDILTPLSLPPPALFPT